MKSFKQFNEQRVNEAKKRSVVLTFGRFNPPTVGHEKLLDKVAKEASGSDYRIYASHSEDPSKNPLGYSEKIKIMRKMFPKHGRNIILDKKIRTVIEAASSLYQQGYTKMKLVVGSDRINEFRKLLNRYNGAAVSKNFYEFKDGIEVVSAGARDPDAVGVSGMSASKMRDAAVSGDFKTFSLGVPRAYGDDMALFNLIRKRMGLIEMTTFRKHVQLPVLSEVRERYVAGDIFNKGDNVMSEQYKGERITIKDRCSNYVVDTKHRKHFITSLVPC